jgi:thiamine biosynthesis lipoprotein
MNLTRRGFALGLAVVAAAACRDRPPAPAGPASALASTSAGLAGSALGSGAKGERPGPAQDAAAESAFAAEKVTAEGHAMGTHLAWAAFTTPELDAAHVRGLFDAATAEIVRLEKLMTTWDPAITFETLHGLWKFDQDLDPHPPSAAQVRERLKYVGYRHVKLDSAAMTVFLDESHVRIGLGGIAKGYAVDRASKVLLDAGLISFYVQAGGDLYTHGNKPDGSPWIAGVRDPRGPEGDYFATMAVSDHAFSTAGDYERSYLVDGRRYHHIIDPHTGYPATASRSVTIWASTALLADEIDDAVFILGPQKGLALVESLDGVGAVIVDANNRVWTSARLEGKVHPVHPPRDAP